LGLYHDTPDRDYVVRLAEVAALGATSILFIVHWFQDDVRSTDITQDRERCASDRVVTQVLLEAKRRGLGPSIMPVVQLRKRGGGEWRGKLAPIDRARWFASYERFVLHYARLCAAADCAALAVGSELVSLEPHRAEWAALIGRVRGVFPGRLTYSANWDHFEEVPFWDLLDQIGINGYFEIARGAEPTQAFLDQRWREVRDRLLAFARTRQKPLLLTEVGYPSVEGGATWPWHYTRKALVDVSEQARAYRALIRAWQDIGPPFEGLYVWNWEGKGGVDDPGYTPRHKPAERLLRSWFSRAR
jgi:hypothetical protein